MILALLALMARPGQSQGLVASMQSPATTQASCRSGQILDGNSCRPIEAVLAADGGRTYWVAQRHPRASDSNAGTKDRPWKTLGRATRKGQLRPGDAVIVRQGLYREAIRPADGGRSGKRITFAAYPGENVVVTGAEVLTKTWRKAGNAWRYPWTTPMPTNGTRWNQEDYWRRELLVANGTVLQPVYSRQALKPGTFFVDGTPERPKALYARMPGDANPNRRTVEAGRRTTLFAPEGMECRTDVKSNNGWYRLIGFTFRHAANHGQRGAICPGAEGGLIENVRVEWTNGTGIKVGGKNHTLRNNTLIENGMAGLAGRCNGCLFEGNETIRNNWKGYEVEAGGGKFVRTVNTTFRDHVARDNRGVGLWFDIDNTNNVVERSLFIGNGSAGLMLELNSNRNIVRNNVIMGSRWDGWRGDGILSQASSRNTIVHNTIMLNEGTGIRIRQDPHERAENGRNVILNNLLIKNAQTSAKMTFEIHIDQTNNAEARSNKLDGNHVWNHDWRKGARGRTFYFRATGYRGADINQWRKITGGAKHSKVVGQGNPLVKDASRLDGWRLVANSVARGAGAPLPASVKVDYDGQTRSKSKPDVGADRFKTLEQSRPTTPVATALRGEAGSVSKEQAAPGQWHKVRLRNRYTNPVVVMGPLSYDGGQPSTVRVRGVSSNSFEFQIDEWAYLDGRHVRETVGYLVVEAGRHTLGNGRVLEAGITRAGSSPKSVRFAKSFGKTPVVAGQIVSTNDKSPAVLRLQDVTSGGFKMYLQGEEKDRQHGAEQVAWIALHEGQGRLGGRDFSAGATPRVVTHAWHGVSFGRRFSSKPVFIATMQTTNGGDPAALRYQNLTGRGVQVFVEEEQSRDEEVVHGNPEVVGFIAVQAGDFSATTSAAAKAVLQNTALTAELMRTGLEGSYPNPARARATVRYRLAEQVPVTLQIFDALGRKVAVLVDEVQPAGLHEAVFEAGSLPGGVYFCRLRAGSLTETRKITVLN